MYIGRLFSTMNLTVDRLPSAQDTSVEVPEDPAAATWSMPMIAS